MSENWQDYGKWQAWDALLGINAEKLSDDERTYWAQRLAELEQTTATENAAGRESLRIDKVVHVLEVVVRTANNDSLRCDQAISQLMAHTRLSERTVKRCLKVLKDCDLVPVLSNGGGPNKRPAVRWVKFVDEYRKRAAAAAGPVDDEQTQAKPDRTQAKLHRTQATSGPHYSITTATPTSAHVATEAQAPTARAAGGNEAREARATDWCEQVAVNVGRALFHHECSKGMNADVHNAEAVIRTQRAARARPWVSELMRRSDAADLRQLAPDDSDLIAWGLGVVLGDGSGAYAGNDACKRAHALGDRQRAAMGAAG